VERVAFLVEKTGQRVSCLLNPESIVVRRTAGIRRRQAMEGALSGPNLSDDPLIYAGGGRTELELDLLFDVTLLDTAAPQDQVPALTDVRDLTEPLRNLTENDLHAQPAGAKSPIVRLVWGKTWNFPGVIAAMAERFESFTPQGVPQRSWLRLRMIRVQEPAPTETPAPEAGIDDLSDTLPPEADNISPEELEGHEVLGTGQEADGPSAGQRLDEIASDKYGSPGAWRFLALFNGIDDPASLSPGAVLSIPPRRLLEQS
jgi:hypothetical protein